MSYAGRLRAELRFRALEWAAMYRLPYESTIGERPAVIFAEDPSNVTGGHGNFHPASWRRIQARPEWRRRLNKRHTTARCNTVSHEAGRGELATAASSDALLMNIFCHPQAFAAGSRLRTLLATAPPEQLRFGHCPRIALAGPRGDSHVERTEIDLQIGGLLIEAKLTETDFQQAPVRRVERYRDFHAVFDADMLPRTEDRYRHYQLIRGALAAHQEPEGRYCVLLDARRPDLIEAWFTVIRAISCSELRPRLQLATWQEIAATMPQTLQKWLAGKYGIADAG